MSESTTASAEPEFHPFSWLPEGDTKSTHTFIAYAMDIAYGIETILQILEVDDLDKTNGKPGQFQKFEIGRLQRLAITSARLLGDTADFEIDRIHKNFHKTAKA